MFAARYNIQSVISEFHTDSMMHYSQFVPKRYNLCKSVDFKPGHIMPSRAFCSDENQGYPIFPLTKCVPWAAYIQDGTGGSRTLAQDEIVSLLQAQSTENPDPIDLEDAIQQMEQVKEIKIDT